MKISSFRFECSVFGESDLPEAAGPEVVFLGRSNVGKSSLINRLLGVRGLARTSSRPGRTQSVNVYRINEAFRFVDLPGYGFAEVPERVRAGWAPMIEGYLDRRRDAIALGIVLLDARRGATELDVRMRDWLRERDIPFLVAATKSDKLSGGALAAVRRRVEKALAPDPGISPPVFVSSRTGSGTREIWKSLDAALAKQG